MTSSYTLAALSHPSVVSAGVRLPICQGDHNVRLVFVHGKMLRRKPIYGDIDVRRSTACPAPKTRRCRFEVPKKQGAPDFSVSDEAGKQESGVEGGKQSQEAIKGEERETDWGLPVC